MKCNSKIFVAGHKGLVGSAIIRKLKSKGFNNIIIKNRNQLDLRNETQTSSFFMNEKPEYVFNAAAKVGGIWGNKNYPAEFIHDNLRIQNNIIHHAYKNGVKKLIFLGSSCIYPKLALQPITEDSLLDGKLETTNDAYAIAKIAGIKMCNAYRQQYGFNAISLMPTNLYGINDNFDSEHSHVIPSLIHRFHQAKTNNLPDVNIWGTGDAIRDFLYIDDLANAVIFILTLDKKIYQTNTEPMLSHINIGTGVGVTIRELAETLKDIIGFKGRLYFDHSLPDGTPIKITDVTRLSHMGWHHKW